MSRQGYVTWIFQVSQGVCKEENNVSQLEEYEQNFEARRFTLGITLKPRSETERGHSENGVG